jgi:hypothetical protein
MIPLLRGLTINVREYQRGDQKWTIQNIWQYKIHNTKKYNSNIVLDTTIHKQTQITVNRTWVLIHTTGGKDESNIVFRYRNGHHNTEVRT